MQKFIYKKEIAQRKLPINLEHKDKILFEKEIKKEFKEVQIKKYQNIYVYSNGYCHKNRLLFDFFVEASYSNVNWKIKIKSYIKFFITKFKVRNTLNLDNAVLITDSWSNGFFHWFGDVLQKLEALKKENIDISNYNFLIPSKCNLSYVEESLKPYNINYTIINQDTKIFVKNLFYIPAISPTGNYRDILMRNMRNRFQKFYNIENKNRKIYITRSKAVKRTITNEDKIIPILEKYGFEIIAMEDFSFMEQYKLIAQCNTLISLHGAGLTHMLWMEQNSKILEIRGNNDSQNNCYFTLASDLNLKYYYSLANKLDEKLSTQNTNFIVDEKDIESKIKIMLKI